MIDQTDPLDCWACSTHKAVLRFYEARYAALVRKVIFRLQRISATGIFGDDYKHRTLWDEYCHEVQNGPHDLLESAWGSTIGALVQSLIEAVPHHEAMLLTIGAMWNSDDETDKSGDVAVFPDLMRRNLESEIATAAANRDMSRFDGWDN